MCSGLHVSISYKYRSTKIVLIGLNRPLIMLPSVLFFYFLLLWLYQTCRMCVLSTLSHGTANMFSSLGNQTLAFTYPNEVNIGKNIIARLGVACYHSLVLDTCPTFRFYKICSDFRCRHSRKDNMRTRWVGLSIAWRDLWTCSNVNRAYSH